MTKSGTQRYPGAITTYWFQSAYPGDAMESNVIVWHATEGTSLPSYDGGALAPNLTAKPDFVAKRLVWFQHFDFDTSSRALRNLAGGVQTNTLNVTQVEIVGTCDPVTHAKWLRAGVQHLYMPELPDWAVRDLAEFAKWAHAEHDVPLTSAVTFKTYPSSYGANGVRMSAEKWLGFSGHCGHQHVPENDHGDPGGMPMAAILAAAKNGTTEEDDMPTPQEYAKAVWDYKLTSPTAAEGTDPTRQAGVFLAYTDAKQKQLLSQLAELKAIEAAQNATIDKLVGAVATLAANIGDLDPAAIVAELRASIESITIHLDVPEA